MSNQDQSVVGKKDTPSSSGCATQTRFWVVTCAISWLKPTKWRTFNKICSGDGLYELAFRSEKKHEFPFCRELENIRRHCEDPWTSWTVGTKAGPRMKLLPHLPLQNDSPAICGQFLEIVPRHIVPFSDPQAHPFCSGNWTPYEKWPCLPFLFPPCPLDVPRWNPPTKT